MSYGASEVGGPRLCVSFSNFVCAVCTERCKIIEMVQLLPALTRSFFPYPVAVSCEMMRDATMYVCMSMLFVISFIYLLLKEK